MPGGMAAPAEFYPWYDPRRWITRGAVEVAPPAAPPPVARPDVPAAPERDTPIIGGDLLARRTRGWASQERAAAPMTAAELRGWAGTRAFKGYVSGHETNPALIGDGWVLTEREMRRTDYSVAAAWRAIRDSLLSARWSFKPGDSDDPVSRQITDAANRLFGFGGHTGRLDRPWEQALEQAILFFSLGWRYGETLFRRMPNGRIDIVDPWVDREPIAHDRWVFDDAGRWLGVIQKPPMGDLGRALGPAPFIPADELVYLSHGVEGMALEGCGALRPAWDAWSRKRDIEDLSMSATEWWSRSVPKIVIDDSATRDGRLSQADLHEQAQQVRGSVRSFLTGDAAWMETTPHVDVVTYGGDLDPSRSQRQIEALDMAIKATVLLGFLNLGTTPTGSRSVGEVHRDLWVASLCQVLDRIAAAYNGHQRPGGGVIGRWVDLNWPNIDPDQYPRLEHAGLSADPLVDAISGGQVDSLTNSGWLDPTNQNDRDRVRHRIGLGLERRDRTRTPGPPEVGGSAPTSPEAT